MCGLNCSRLPPLPQWTTLLIAVSAEVLALSWGIHLTYSFIYGDEERAQTRTMLIGTVFGGGLGIAGCLLLTFVIIVVRIVMNVVTAFLQSF